MHIIKYGLWHRIEIAATTFLSLITAQTIGRILRDNKVSTNCTTRSSQCDGEHIYRLLKQNSTMAGCNNLVRW